MGARLPLGSVAARAVARVSLLVLGPLVLAVLVGQPRVHADASDGSWSPLSSAGAPSPRAFQMAVWTGQQLLLWGGVGGTVQPHADHDGARYNPKTQTWRPMATAGAPPNDTEALVAWTGSEFLIWGGTGCVPAPCTSGARYDPAINTWRPMASAGAPQGSVDASAVWTGKELLVWGGFGPPAAPGQPSRVHGDGAAYNPVTDTWRPLSNAGAPTPRWDQVAVWTGRQVLIWGGDNGQYQGLTDGAAYDPATETWSPLPTAGAPSARLAETAVWTGQELLIWGGQHNLQTVDDGAAYNPTTRTWRPLPTEGAPGPRENHTAVWTGRQMLIWGGVTEKGSDGDPNGHYGDGADYDPTTNTWTPLPAAGAPSPRVYQTAVWTGRQMLIWGGRISYSRDYIQPLGDGAAYTPPAAPPGTAPSAGPPASLPHTGAGGAERLQISTAGNVGIGTTAPAAALDINNAALPQLVVRGGSTTALRLFPTGGSISSLEAFATTDPSLARGYSRLRLTVDGTTAWLIADASGGPAPLPLAVQVGGAERLPQLARQPGHHWP